MEAAEIACTFSAAPSFKGSEVLNMGRKNFNTYAFDGWISISLPEGWEYEQDTEDTIAILNVYSLRDPKGVLQVSFYRVDGTRNKVEIANDFVNRFVGQFNVQVDENTRMVIHRDDYTIGMAVGNHNGRFLKVWCLTEGERTLLATYNSAKRTRELSTVDDIVFGVKFI